MAGIAGVFNPTKSELAEKMIHKIGHRGWAWTELVENEVSVVAMNGIKIQENALGDLKNYHLAKDGCVPGRFAEAQLTAKDLVLKRDPLGAAPLYYGWTKDGDLCFSSEIKALILATTEIFELPPGCSLKNQKIESYFYLKPQDPLDESPEEIALELRKRLEASVEKSIGNGNVGSWLSGGIDSSILAALARKQVKHLQTFAAGLEGAPDLMYARQMAEFIKSEHHEVVVKPVEIITILPEVIYYLESFDALLVRSSILNFLAARYASHFVPAVFSGEGADELFGGYSYLKDIPGKKLADELVDIIGRLHNTALQRVDRCASAHGTLPHIGFLDPDVVDLALRIPAKYKIHDGVEKWILRKAAQDLLPEAVLNRPKAKFWQGGGFNGFLADYANSQVSDQQFNEERNLKNGWQLNSKEEVLYYRIFAQHFGQIENLNWMGRTKGSPKTT